MSIVTKLIGMVALGQTAAETRIAVHNFLTGLAAALALALICGLMIGALLVGAHYALYAVLVAFTTLTPLEALAITFATGFVITGALIYATVQQMKVVFNLPKQLHVESYEAPITTRVAGIAEAFLDGLTGRTAQRF